MAQSRDDDMDSFVSDNNSVDMNTNPQQQFMAAPVSYRSESKSNVSSDGYGQENNNSRRPSKQARRQSKKKATKQNRNNDDESMGSKSSVSSNTDVISEESSQDQRKSQQSDSESDKTVGFFDNENNSDDERISSEEEEENNTVIRVYDARFKIPDQTALGQMFSGMQLQASVNKTQAKQKYTRSLRRASWYKKFVSYSMLVLMGVAMLITITLYAWRLYQLTTDKFFVARYKVTTTEEIEFEEITSTRIEYFLYKNTTEGAKDADSNNNFFIVENINEICEFSGKDDIDSNTATDLSYVTLESKSRMTQIRDNIKSPYTLVSEGFVLLSMIGILIANTVYVPFYLKEHQIPIVFRSPQSNIFFDVTRVRLYLFVAFIMLSACIPHVIFYYTDHPCLHTVSQEDFGIDWTDYYQYSMMACVWVISTPVGFFLLGQLFKDSIRYIWYPIMIANLVFVLMLFTLSMIVVAFGIKGSSSSLLRLIYVANLGVVVVCGLLNAFYNAVFSKRDLLRADDDEEVNEY